LVKPHLNEEIQYIGPVGPKQRDELLGSAKALLHPIFFDEPFGLSVAEAQLCGTPVIAFSKGAMPELIKNMETGFLVNNVNEAVNAVSSLLNINRSTCRQWAMENFSQQKMVENYYKCYLQ
jgi:glycosyltransferase involved in cell wall biosynthesis